MEREKVQKIIDNWFEKNGKTFPKEHICKNCGAIIKYDEIRIISSCSEEDDDNIICCYIQIQCPKCLHCKNNIDLIRFHDEDLIYAQKCQEFINGINEGNEEKMSDALVDLYATEDFQKKYAHNKTLPKPDKLYYETLLRLKYQSQATINCWIAPGGNGKGLFDILDYDNDEGYLKWKKLQLNTYFKNIYSSLNKTEKEFYDEEVKKLENI